MLGRFNPSRTRIRPFWSWMRPFPNVCHVRFYWPGWPCLAMACQSWPWLVRGGHGQHVLAMVGHGWLGSRILPGSFVVVFYWFLFFLYFSKQFLAVLAGFIRFGHGSGLFGCATLNSTGHDGHVQPWPAKAGYGWLGVVTASTGWQWSAMDGWAVESYLAILWSFFIGSCSSFIFLNSVWLFWLVSSVSDTDLACLVVPR